MKALYDDLQRGRLELSERSRQILKAEYMQFYRQEQVNELKGLVDSRVPFGSLETIPPRQLQQTLASIKTKSLAYALLEDESSLPVIQKNMSRQANRDLADELMLARKFHKRDDLPLNLLVSARREIAARLEEIVLDDDDEYVS
jgi:flagellar motor switch protein FliG